MKKYIIMMVFMLMISGCKTKVDDSIVTTEEESIEVEATGEENLPSEEIGDTEEVLAEGSLIINADHVNVYSSFDIEATIISEVYQNEIVAFYNIKEDSEGNEWYKIGADKDEWIAGSLCIILDIDSIVGIYEYEYPYNTEDYNENHSLVFEIEDNYLIGRYYGTTDDFDPVREGYYVGYYVSEMLNLRFEDNKISFELNPLTADMFTEKIPLEIKNTQEAMDSGFINWQPGANITEPVAYSGYFDENSITLETPYGIRELKKVSGSGD